MEVLLFARKKLHQLNKQFSWTYSKKASKSVCTSAIVVPSDSLSPAPSTSSAMKTPENTEEDPGDPGPADGEDIQME